ncbi:hypothetical protein ZHAS_00021659 [Anopheles sinensis]|uniref:Uncharacterized protein n=1 Tax=Anopheles sinensis TaxID=74873 RepID=A0A084WT06_ANOSI|nr:hypothetical protein ZHAS_00021659 [Anopheles sinensis]
MAASSSSDKRAGDKRSTFTFMVVLSASIGSGVCAPGSWSGTWMIGLTTRNRGRCVKRDGDGQGARGGLGVSIMPTNLAQVAGPEVLRIMDLVLVVLWSGVSSLESPLRIDQQHAQPVERLTYRPAFYCFFLVDDAR